jgi:hypothetical protein
MRRLGLNVMPEFTYRDRTIVMQESDLWTIHGILVEASKLDSSFQKKIIELREAAKILASELRDYNDQFESDDE